MPVILQRPLLKPSLECRKGTQPTSTYSIIITRTPPRTPAVRPRAASLATSAFVLSSERASAPCHACASKRSWKTRTAVQTSVDRSQAALIGALQVRSRGQPGGRRQRATSVRVSVVRGKSDVSDEGRRGGRSSASPDVSAFVRIWLAHGSRVLKSVHSTEFLLIVRHVLGRERRSPSLRRVCERAREAALHCAAATPAWRVGRFGLVCAARRHPRNHHLFGLTESGERVPICSEVSRSPGSDRLPP